MKRLYSLLIVLISGLSIYLQPLYASDFEYQGFKYTILSKENRTVELTEKPANGIKGDIVLPSIVIDRKDSTHYTLTSIGERAFASGGHYFTGITIPNTVKNIKRGAFFYCYNLKSVVLPDSLEELGNGAFSNCEYLSSAIVLPNTLKTLGKYVFLGNQYLPEVKLPNNLKEIPDSLFYYCRSLKSPVIPVGVERIGRSAFEDNYMLDTIILPNSVREIGEEAFRGSGLRKIQLPDYIENIGNGAFASCKFEEFVVPKGINTIVPNMFARNYLLHTIKLHPDVTTIDKNAFYGCEKLKTFDIRNISEIGESAFEECKSIQSIELPSTIKIGSNAFSGCDSIQNVDLPSIIEIGESAFSNCPNIKHLILPSSITSIKYKAFNGCTKLQTIVVGNEESQDVSSEISIGFSAFKSLPELESVIINKTINNIGECAFQSCYNLRTFECPVVIAVGAYAFQGCSKLSEFNFEFIKNLSDGSFGQCGFESVELPAIEKFPYAQNHYNYVYSGIFYNCPLKTVKIFGTISSISLGRITDAPNKIETFVLGPNISYFSRGGEFSNELKNFYVLNPVPPRTDYDDPFSNYNVETAILYVPKGTVEAYQKAPTWKRFTHIVEIETSGIDDIVTTDDNITVEVIGNSILVNGDTGSFPIELYTLSGVCVYNGHNQIIDGLSKGFYILKVGTKTMKVIV